MISLPPVSSASATYIPSHTLQQLNYFSSDYEHVENVPDDLYERSANVKRGHMELLARKTQDCQKIGKPRKIGLITLSVGSVFAERQAGRIE